MTLIGMIVVLVLVGVILALLNSYGAPYIAPAILKIINVVVVVVVILWILSVFGVLNSVNIPVPRYN